MRIFFRNNSGALLIVFAVMFPLILVMFALALDGANSMRTRGRLNDAAKQGLYAIAVMDSGNKSADKEVIAYYVKSYVNEKSYQDAEVWVDYKDSNLVPVASGAMRLYIDTKKAGSSSSGSSAGGKYMVKRDYVVSVKLGIKPLLGLKLWSGEGNRLGVSSDTHAMSSYTKSLVLVAQPNLKYGNNSGKLPYGFFYVSNPSPNAYQPMTFEGPKSEWVPDEGFLLQDVNKPWKNLPTSGFNGAFFDLYLVEGIKGSDITVSKSLAGSSVGVTLEANPDGKGEHVVRVKLNGLNLRHSTWPARFEPTTFELFVGDSGIKLYSFQLQKWFISAQDVMVKADAVKFCGSLSGVGYRFPERSDIAYHPCATEPFDTDGGIGDYHSPGLMKLKKEYGDVTKPEYYGFMCYGTMMVSKRKIGPALTGEWGAISECFYLAYSNGDESVRHGFIRGFCRDGWEPNSSLKPVYVKHYPESDFIYGTVEVNGLYTHFLNDTGTERRRFEVSLGAGHTLHGPEKSFLDNLQGVVCVSP